MRFGGTREGAIQMNLHPICPIHNTPFKLDAWEEDVGILAFFLYFSDPHGCRFRSQVSFPEIGSVQMTIIRDRYPHINTARLRVKGK